MFVCGLWIMSGVECVMCMKLGNYGGDGGWCAEVDVCGLIVGRECMLVLGVVGF